MPTPFQAPRRLAAPFILATASLSLLLLHCSSDDGQTTGNGGTSTAGTTTVAGSTSGGMTAGGTTGGTVSGGSTAAGSSAGGTTAGAGGSAAGSSAGGSGGSAGGSAGSAGSAGSGGSGGSGATFAQVQALLAKSCAGAKCHNPESDQMDWTTADGLYTRLTTPIPADIPLCIGKTPIVANTPD